MVEPQFSEPPNAAWSSNKAVIPRAEGELWNLGEAESDLGDELLERAKLDLETGNRCDMIIVGEEHCTGPYCSSGFSCEDGRLVLMSAIRAISL